MDDYSSFYEGLSVASAIAAILAAGLIMTAPYVASWVVDKVSSFFDGADDEDDDEGADWVCDYCGEAQDEDAYCSDAFGNGDRMCGLCARDDSRWE